MMYNLPDVQETMEPIINSPIKQVGVENIMLNFSLELKTGGVIHIPSKTTIKTNLGPSKKGISMSRLLLTLKPYLGYPLKHSTIVQLSYQKILLFLENVKIMVFLMHRDLMQILLLKMI